MAAREDAFTTAKSDASETDASGSNASASNSSESIATDRIVWIDASKGLAITLMVFGHVLGGAVERGVLDPEGPARDIYQYIYLFHMPLFFLVSGLFCIAPMRANPVNALVARTQAIAWPYLFWEFLVGTAVLLITATSGPPSDIGWLDRFVRAMTGELSWFLWTMYVMQAMLIPFARSPVRVLFAASIFLCLSLQNTDLGTFSLVIDHLPFLLFGAMVRPFASRFVFSDRWTPLLLSAGAFLLLWLSLSAGWTEYKIAWLLCGLAGSLATMCLVQCLGRTIERTILANIGAATLAIYLLHPYFLKAGLELAVYISAAAPLVSPLGQLVILTIIGVAGPFFAWKLAERRGLSWLFRLKLSISLPQVPASPGWRSR
jgi:fucose 4-O-acetylase-like acetyltransferase